MVEVMPKYILRGTRSLFARIAIRNRENYFVAVGPGWERNTTERLVPCTRTQARSACIRELASKRPWATLVDLEILLEGWDMGEAWTFQHKALDSCTAPLGIQYPSIRQLSQRGRTEECFKGTALQAGLGIKLGNCSLQTAPQNHPKSGPDTWPLSV